MPGINRGERSGIVARTGRPKADKPKSVQYGIRLDAETERKLELYCAAKGVTKAQACRRGIELLIGKHGDDNRAIRTDC